MICRDAVSPGAAPFKKKVRGRMAFARTEL